MDFFTQIQYNKVMKKKVIIYSFIIVIIDLISKLVIDKLLKINETISIINNAL